MIISGLGQANQDLLPIHPLPFRDELLSSWLVRLAHSNHFKVHTFCRLYIGETRQIWNRDIDAYVPIWLIDAMCRITGLAKEVVEQTTLRSFEGILFDQIYSNTVTPWILPLGIYHRDRKLYGLQYCPICLKLDTQPYFRKYWRSSFYTVCEFHHVLMQDHCPNCCSPVVFYRNDIGFKKETFYSSITTCHICGMDLTQSVSYQIHYPCSQIAQAFKSLLTVYRRGWVDLPLPQIMYSQIFLQGLRIIISLLVSTKLKARLSLAEIEADMGIKDNNYLKKSITFERRQIHERHRLLIGALWILMDWPYRFHYYYKKFNLTKSIIFQDIKNPPYFIYEAMNI